MRVPFVDLKSQYLSIKEEIDIAISEIISNSAFIGGSYVEAFEKEFAAYCNVNHCIGVGNGTDALFIALKALNIGKGDEVITAANSFIATSEAITMAGANVTFIDINPTTYNIDVTRIEEKITNKTKAIIPVHLYGQPADMDPIIELARRYDLKIIEDAAQAHGAQYKGRTIGSIGDVACFSFYPGKNLGAYGDAGAIVTNDKTIALRVRMYANHGRVAKYNHELEGVNSRLDSIQAAILSVKIKYLSAWTDKRRYHASHYSKMLADFPLTTPSENEFLRHVYHLYVIRVNTKIRDKLQKFLLSNEINTGIHYPISLPALKAYAHLNHSKNDFPEATKHSQQVLSLPLYPELTEEQMHYITKKISLFFTQNDN